jgi:hypothetical protein
MKTSRFIVLLVVGTLILNSCLFNPYRNKSSVLLKLKISHSKIHDSEEIADLLTERIRRFGGSGITVSELERNVYNVFIKSIDNHFVPYIAGIFTNLDFKIYESYEGKEIIPYFEEVNKKLFDIIAADTSADLSFLKVEEEKIKKGNDVEKEYDLDFLMDDSTEEVEKDDAKSWELEVDCLVDDPFKNQLIDINEYPLYAVMQPYIAEHSSGYYFVDGPILGTSWVEDTLRVNHYFSMDEVKKILPDDLKLFWSEKVITNAEGSFAELIAIKDNFANTEILTKHIKNAEVNVTPTGELEITLRMNGEGADLWAYMTERNIGRSLVIVINGKVYSYPTVQSTIIGGKSSISGIEKGEAYIIRDLINLKEDKLPFNVEVQEIELLED